MTTSETKDVLTHHLTAFGNNDLDEIMKDYTEASEVFTQAGLLKSLDTIRKFFADYFVTIPTGSAFGMIQLIVSNNTAYIIWNSKSDVADIPFGTDTFFLDGDKIKYHTVAAYMLSQ